MDLEGIWQDNPKLGIYNGRTIVFYPNSDLVYYHNQDECYKKEKAWIGQWKQRYSRTMILFDLTVLLENGNLERIKTLCAGSNKPKLQEKIVRSLAAKIPSMNNNHDYDFEYKLPPEGDTYYPSVKIFDIRFYKTSNDPEDYKEKIDIKSYKKERPVSIDIR